MKLNILVIGRHGEIVETLLRLLHKIEHWAAQSALQDDTAISLFHQFNFDIVLLSSGISESSEQKLCSHFRERRPNIIIIQHYGGGSGLLTNEILQALHQHNAAIGRD